MPLLSWRKLQAGLGTLDKLIQNVRSGQLDSSSIYTETLKDAAITTVKINTAAVTNPKLATVYSADDYLYHSHDAETSTTATTYTKLKEVYIPFGGTIRVKVDFRASGDGSGSNANGQIYRNGSAVGTERTLGVSDPWTNFSEDLSGWAEGDLLQVYMKLAGAGGGAYCRNLRLYVASSNVIVPMTIL